MDATRFRHHYSDHCTYEDESEYTCMRRAVPRERKLHIRDSFSVHGLKAALQPSRKRPVTSSTRMSQGHGETMRLRSDENHLVSGHDSEEHQALTLANQFKGLSRPSIPLDGWQAKRFAFEDGRAAELEALRIDEYPCDFKIARVDISEITPESFREDFDKRSKPLMVTGIPEAMGWGATEKWTWEALERTYGGVEFKVSSDKKGKDLRMRLEDYMRYARVQTDDSPLYVFDQAFVETSRDLDMRREYEVPELFTEDLFSYLGSKRPPFRWFLAGPKRSGTAVHIDPLGTSAWNTLLSGRKLWVLSRPGTLEDLKGTARGDSPEDAPPKDESTGDAEKKYSVQAIEYFLDILPEISEKVRNSIELCVLVQHPGETLFVPAGWPHCVVNLDDTVAVTQNFVSSFNFDQVWRAVRKEKPRLGLRWLQRLLFARPELVLRALKLDEEDQFNLLKAADLHEDDSLKESNDQEYAYDKDWYLVDRQQ